MVLSDPSAFCPFYSPLYVHSFAYFIQFVITVFSKNIGLSSSNTIHTRRLPHETEEEHISRHRKRVHEIFDILCQNDLYLKPEKCQFEQSEIEFLSVRVGNGMIQMDPAKVEGVKNWPIPKTPTEVCAFLSFTGYYQYFIQNYSTIARP